jgi:GDP-4-dehydro-6-deoxy-D-mannose reductase
MRALVTGSTGFVGSYLVDALKARGDDVFACGGPGDRHAFPLDLADPATVRAALDLAQPDLVFHLAAQTFVPDSLATPDETYRANVTGTANVARAIREYAADERMPRLLFTSSAEVYGRQPEDAFPLRERTALAPSNPYAASKAAAEMLLLGEIASFGLDVVIARSFNTIGPGQNERFVISNFASQIARIAGGAEPVLYVGNLDAKRDFLDVRDVVQAYIALANDGLAGETYNVCSGVAYPIRDALRELIIAAHVPVEVREDPARMRPSDTPLFVGDNTKLRSATGWKPEIPFRQSIREIYAAACKLGTS